MDESTGQRVECRLRDKGRQKVTVTTLCGALTVWRKRWQFAAGGCDVPLDRWLGIAEGLVTKGTVALGCLLNRGATSFEHAAECLRKAAGVRIGKEQLRQLLVAAGQAMQQAIRRGALQPDWTAGDCTVNTERGTVRRVYLGSDGVKVPLITQAEKQRRREKALQQRRTLRRAGKRLAPLPPLAAGADQRYKEFKLVTYYAQDHARRIVSITDGDHEAAGRIMKRDASRLALHEADEAIGLFDGAPWIVNQTYKQGLPLSGRGLDFYHLRDNIHRTRREVFGETEAGGAWAHDLAETFKTDGFTAGWNRLLAWRATLRRRAHQQSADRLITYISDRRELIAYPEFRAQGWDIGSGPTEAQCKTTTNRLKGRGRRWNPANALAISTIEAVYQSRLHKMFWNLN